MRSPGSFGPGGDLAGGGIEVRELAAPGDVPAQRRPRAILREGRVVGLGVGALDQDLERRRLAGGIQFDDPEGGQVGGDVRRRIDAPPVG